MILPESFCTETQRVLGEERWERFVAALDEEIVSVRRNPARETSGHDGGESPGGGSTGHGGWSPGGESAGHDGRGTGGGSAGNDGWGTGGRSAGHGCCGVAWCPEGRYLRERPAFTFDPLLHAGCYYVQEAASMFVSHVLRQWVTGPVRMLDLCAAPGGKSTAAIAVLPKGSSLVSNEPIRARAMALLENMTKWGHPRCAVTNLYPRDFVKAKARFDVVLTDVPCSGEGMFRKDPKAIAEWSPAKVEQCRRLQREIVSDAWQCLEDGGLLIYSTCTLNTRENEENIAWIRDELGGVVLPVDVKTEWGITGSLLTGFDEPVYRFIPGLTRSEGLFVAVVRKTDRRLEKIMTDRRTDDSFRRMEKIMTDRRTDDFFRRTDGLFRRMDEGVLKELREVLSVDYVRGTYPEVEADYKTAISYLRGEALRLPPEVPKGIICVTYQGHPIGVVKNIGSRANNLHPKEWRIKSTHVPEGSG